MDQSANSAKPTASELMIRGENIFGAQEKDTKTSATFLIILLNCIEKWAQIEYGQPGSGCAENTSNYSFKGVYKELKRINITFPSSFNLNPEMSNRKNKSRKTVTFNFDDSDNEEGKQINLRRPKKERDSSKNGRASRGNSQQR